MLQPLSIVWDFDPVFFSIGSFDIRYYGVMWALAILIGAKLFDNFVKREGLPSSVSESIFIYGTLATIIGARLGHCLFYDPVEYLRQPWTIITGFRDGGLASHGAAVGLLIGLWLFSRRNRLPYIWSLDRIGIAVAIAGALVRIGNLLNSEIYGIETSLPWGFIFVRNGEVVPKHPTQLYEAFSYLILFVILWWMYYRKDLARRRPGVMFGFFLIVLFGVRVLIEFVKNPQEAFEENMFLNMGQLLSLPFILAGVVILWRALRKPALVPAPLASSPSPSSSHPHKPKKK